MLYGSLPIVEMGIITEFYADAFDIEVVGDNFWITYYRVLHPPGEYELVRVPVARVGRAIASLNPALFTKIRPLTH